MKDTKKEQMSTTLKNIKGKDCGIVLVTKDSGLVQQ